jgi:hypothetical protein
MGEPGCRPTADAVCKTFATSAALRQETPTARDRNLHPRVCQPIWRVEPDPLAEIVSGGRARRDQLPWR